MGFVQILILLVQAFPAALQAIKAWQEYHGKKLTAENRKRLASDVKVAMKAAVQSRSTEGLEGVIKNLGKPQPIPGSTDTPNP